MAAEQNQMPLTVLGRVKAIWGLRHAMVSINLHVQSDCSRSLGVL